MPMETHFMDTSAYGQFCLSQQKVYIIIFSYITLLNEDTS